MNLDKHPKTQDLINLIKECDDRAGPHVLWVARNGDVNLSRETPPDSDLQLKFVAFEAGNEYVGPKAAEDSDWIKELFAILKKKWREAKGKANAELIDQL